MRRLLLLLMVAGCVPPPQRPPSWERPGLAFGAVSPEILDHMVQNGDQTFAGRDKPAAIDDAMESWSGALRYRPDDVALLVRLSRAARLRSHSLPAVDADGKAREAIAYAEHALVQRNYEVWKLAHTNKPPVEVFAVAEVADVPALLAYAQALFDWGEAREVLGMAAQRDWISAAAERALKLDAGADFAAADRILGMLDAALQPKAGRDLRAAQAHFEAALAAAPNYLPTRLEYAERWCKPSRDKARRRRLLHEVADGNSDALPDAAPENRAAQQRARAIIAHDQSL